jgi:hypothetical protein
MERVCSVRDERRAPPAQTDFLVRKNGAPTGRSGSLDRDHIMRARQTSVCVRTIVVLRDRAIVQSGPALDIFHKPATALVSRFLGIAARTSLLSHHLTRYL